MSKKKRRRRFRSAARTITSNRHHLLYQAKNWNTGMAKELHGAFVYRLPIEIHNELHNHTLRDVPRPPPEALKTLYLAWRSERLVIGQMSAEEAARWLSEACDYAPFNRAMRIQANFLEQNLTGRA